jgi:hypothetical protein
MVDEEDERVKVGLKDGKEGSLKGNASAGKVDGW